MRKELFKLFKTERKRGKEVKLKQPPPPPQHILLHQMHKIMIFKMASYDPFKNNRF